MWVLPETYEDQEQDSAAFEREGTPGAHTVIWLVDDDRPARARRSAVEGDDPGFGIVRPALSRHGQAAR